MLIPHTRIATKAHSVIERMKDSRLRGADLYVARLGWSKQAVPTTSTKSQPSPDHATPQQVDSAESDDITCCEPSLGSLHEELRFREPDCKLPSVPGPIHEQASASPSRPCYRCISYMHCVGIKRVFWTNGTGEWEGGKVRDLVDALETSGASDRNNENGCGNGVGGARGGAAGNGVFVTKHEVLMLRRLMGSS